GVLARADQRALHRIDGHERRLRKHDPAASKEDQRVGGPEIHAEVVADRGAQPTRSGELAGGGESIPVVLHIVLGLGKWGAIIGPAARGSWDFRRSTPVPPPVLHTASMRPPETSGRRRRRVRARARRRGLLVFLVLLVGVVGGAGAAKPESKPDTGDLGKGSQPNGHHTPTPEPSASNGYHFVKSLSGLLLPNQTPTTPGPDALPEDVPIKHVVFMIKENRTFNNYF